MMAVTVSVYAWPDRNIFWDLTRVHADLNATGR